MEGCGGLTDAAQSTCFHLVKVGLGSVREEKKLWVGVWVGGWFVGW